MLNKRWIFFLPVIVAVIIFLLLKQSSPEPQQKIAEEMTTAVRTLSIAEHSVSPTAIGYGTVRPVSTWEAIAQVEGIIIEKNPMFKKGAIIEKGSVLLQIDPVDYELNISQIDADILATKAQMEEIDTREENTQASLEIEKKSLQLTKNELKRLKNLLQKKSVSYSDFESQERNMLTQQQSVLVQKNSLKLIPAQRALLEAQLQQKHSQLKRAQRDLLNTKVVMPFTGRISVDNVEPNQYVRVGEQLIAADALDKAEIEVQIPIRYFRGLLRSGKSVNLLDPEMLQLDKKLMIKAMVVLQEGGISTRWKARFSRLSDTLDPKTRTVGVIVEVTDPYGNVTPGSRPPLLKGLFVEVHLLGATRPNSLLVPRSALHNKHLYRINKQNRLEIIKVQIQLYQPEFAIVSSTSHSLAAGDSIIISDLTPAIEGMLLSPQRDKETEQRLNTLANMNAKGNH